MKKNKKNKKNKRYIEKVNNKDESILKKIKNFFYGDNNKNNNQDIDNSSFLKEEKRLDKERIRINKTCRELDRVMKENDRLMKVLEDNIREIGGRKDR